MNIQPNIPSQLPPQMENEREMLGLRKHFPDWEDRINYQKKQAKLHRSTLTRISEAKRMGRKWKLTAKEQDALDYFNGENFYNYQQNVGTPPNIFDTRRSFLLKMKENPEMRIKFLKACNRKETEN